MENKCNVFLHGRDRVLITSAIHNGIRDTIKYSDNLNEIKEDLNKHMKLLDVILSCKSGFSEFDFTCLSFLIDALEEERDRLSLSGDNEIFVEEHNKIIAYLKIRVPRNFEDEEIDSIYNKDIL